MSRRDAVIMIGPSLPEPEQYTLSQDESPPHADCRRCQLTRRWPSGAAPADLPIPALPAGLCWFQDITTGEVMQLRDLKARIERLEGLAKGPAREVELQRGVEGRPSVRR